MNLEQLRPTLGSSRPGSELSSALKSRAQSFAGRKLQFSGGMYSTVAAHYLSQAQSCELIHLRMRHCVWMETRSARAYAARVRAPFQEIECEDPQNTWSEERMRLLPESVSAAGIPLLVPRADGAMNVTLNPELLKELELGADRCFFWDRAILSSVFTHPCLKEFVAFSQRFPVGSSRYWIYVLFHHVTGLELHDFGFSGTENLPAAPVRGNGLQVSLEEWMRFLE